MNSLSLVLFPLFIMGSVALMNQTGLSGSAQVNFNNQASGTSGSITDCSGFPITAPLINLSPCFSSQPSSSTVVTCVSPSGPVTDSFGNKLWGCVIVSAASGCPSWATVPLTCTLNAIPPIVFLNKGSTWNGNGNNFPGLLGASNFFSVSADFMILLVGLIALGIVASIQILGSGLNSEAALMMVEGGGMIALWAIAVLASGFGGTTSFWAAIDSASKTLGIGFGTVIVSFLSMTYLVGTLRFLSRGGT